MVVDTAIVRQVFEGMLPVVFTLSPKDLVTMKQPDPIYVRCPASPAEGFGELALTDDCGAHARDGVAHRCR